MRIVAVGRQFVRCTVISFGLLLSTTVPVSSQTRGSNQPSFEVASIKPNTSGQRGFSSSDPGHFFSTGTSLKYLIGYAYRVPDSQILGAEGWIDTAKWDIQAKIEDGTIPVRTQPPDLADLFVPDALALMVQSLLKDRFGLRVHRDKKEFPVYELKVHRGGLKIKRAQDQTPIGPPEAGILPRALAGGQVPRGVASSSRGRFQGAAIPLAMFINTLSQRLDRTVIDKTGLNGLFDVDLRWTPDVAQDPGSFAGLQSLNQETTSSGSSIFTAVQEQLGLELVSTKGLLDTIVIDSARQPAQN